MKDTCRVSASPKHQGGTDPGVVSPSVSRVQQVMPPQPPPLRQVPQTQPQAGWQQEQGYAQPPAYAQNDQVYGQAPRQEAPPAPAPAPDAAADAAPKPKPPSFFAKIRKPLIVLLLGVGSYVGYTIWETRQPYEWSGSVEAKSASLGSRVGGRVKDILVREGDEVKAGTPLVTLEPAELLAQKAIAVADLESAKAALDKLVRGARSEEIASARARAGTMQAAGAQASALASAQRAELKRARDLYAAGAISKAELDATQAATLAASAGVVRASSGAMEAQAQLNLVKTGNREEDIRAAKAMVAAAQARVDAADGALEELTIRAPRAGRIESINVRPGDMLRPNATAATLLEAGQLYVRIFVPETLIGKISAGQEVPIIVDSFPNRPFKGRVEHINDIGEFTPHRLVTTDDRAHEVFGARVAILEGENELRAGMIAFVHVKKK